MAKFRVYEIAKKYNKDNKEILEILKANHVEVKNHMSTIGDEQIKMIENALKPKKEAKQDHNSKKQENSKLLTTYEYEHKKDFSYMFPLNHVS